MALLIILSGFFEYQIVNLQSQLSRDQSTINSLNTKEAAMNSTITNLDNQLSLDPDRIVDGFSIVQITDTQFLSDSLPGLYSGLTSWIANKASALNLTIVVHTGDIVQVASSAGDWQNASNAMMTLYNNGVPYCWNAGNHDQDEINNTVGRGNPDASWIGGNYPGFNVTMMRKEPYWVGDIFDGKSTAVQFIWGNYHFMVINIEYNANQTVLDWMQTLVKTNPNVNVIVATHDFLNATGGYGTLNHADVVWATNFEKLLNNYPNVFMTINGHATIPSNSTATGYNKKAGKREEVFFNRQQLNSLQGAAAARIYTFEMSHPANPGVDVYTYQTFGTPHYITDPMDQFNFSTSLKAYSPSTVSIPSGTEFLGSSGYSVSFATSTTLAHFSQNGYTLRFNDLTLNGFTSNLTATAVGADIVVTNYNPDKVLSYMVSQSGGTQTFSVNAAPSSVVIDGSPAKSGDGWSYSKGEVTVTGAASSVTINLT
ncbi:MAG: metallophosphoesterase [Candidatus Bathyarchaeia archaeon]|jgi:hypothetical protein